MDRTADVASDPLVGRLLDGRYRLDRPLAKGGMATVYVGTDTRLDRTVAVKVMRPALAEDPSFVERFAGEARAAARLSSPEVVAVHDQGTDDATGTAYLVMEYVEGRTLRDLIRDGGPLPPARALELLEPVLRALAAAHRAGLVHRDVKPENVLLGDDGRIKVADFGLARAVQTSHLTATTGLLIGTVAYLAPEQARPGGADERSDVYAAGIVLWEMLTGTPPFSGDDAIAVLLQHANEDVPPPSAVVHGVPVALDDLVIRATRRDPSARPADAGAFLAELQAVRADLPSSPVAQHTQVIARPTPTVDTIRPHKRRRAGLIAAALVAVLALLALAGGWYLGSGRYRDAPSVLGVSRQVAVAKLEGAGLKAKDGGTVFSDTVPNGMVADQDPDPNGKVRKGGTVTYILSKGPDVRAVPDLVGSTQLAAKQLLEAAGLRLGKTSQEYASASRGTVVRTDPKAGQKLRPGTAVKLVLSAGVEQLKVPDVQGKPVAEAQATLKAAGFKTSVDEVFKDDVPKGIVFDQSPSTGTAGRGSTISLQVSKGPELITVPKVTGMRRDDAQRLLEGLGLKVSVRSIPGPGIVRQQDPGEGAQVRKGSTVTLYVF
ncbi:MAG: PASTA domain-containing protein [Actinobacteria bacterium]|nr:PASTA domain-containing protein [Actinomycetota bacterium]MCA1721564.1 PASTA domain-containing protein [Actinomycetota bacterium]